MDIEPQIEDHMTLLLQESALYFKGSDFQTQLLTLERTKAIEFALFVLPTAVVNKMLQNYACFMILTLQKRFPDFCDRLLCEKQVINDLYFIKLMYPFVYQNFEDLKEAFGKLLEYEDSIRKEFKKNFQNLFQEFEKNRLFIIQNILNSRLNLFEQVKDDLFQKLHALLSLEGFVYICGSEFSGKTHLVNQYLQLFPSEDYVYIAVDKTTDLNTLLGNYMISNSEGEAKFKWKDGPIVNAIVNGKLCILENFELATDQLKSFIASMLQNKSLKTKNRNIFFHRLFKLIIVTRDQQSNSQKNLIFKEKFVFEEFLQICLSGIKLDQSKMIIMDKLCRIAFETTDAPSFYKLNKLISRIFGIISRIVPQSANNLFMASDTKRLIILTFVELFCENSLEDFFKSPFAEKLCEIFEIQSNLILPILKGVEYYFKIHQGMLKTIRHQVPLVSHNKFSPEFVVTSKTAQSLDAIFSCIHGRENVLLIGETGCGKTTMVQELSRLFNKKLSVFNVSHSTDAFDLFGGFRPINQDVSFRHEIELIESVLKDIYPTQNNQPLISKLYEFWKAGRYMTLAKAFYRTGSQIMKDLRSKIETMMKSDYKSSFETGQIKVLSEIHNNISSMVTKNAHMIQNSGSSEKEGSSLNLEFIKGVILQAIEKNEWLLLDEINLANEEVLFRLYQILFEEKIFVSETGDCNFVRKHSEFRLFACMNPAFEVGKKPLPKRIKEGFTVLNIPAVDSVEEIREILSDILKTYQVFTYQFVLNLAEFYCKIRENAKSGSYLDKYNKKTVFTLRQLRRGCNITKAAMQNELIHVTPINAIYAGVRLAFYLDLNSSSKKLFDNLFDQIFQVKGIQQIYLSSSFYRLDHQFENQNEYFIWEGFPVKKMTVKAKTSAKSDVIVTPNIKTIICDLLRVLLYDESRPILLEGPTSVGKTSIVVFLAELIDQKVVRLNNHRDTDLDEYIGTYVPDESGKINFQEGVLLQCMREGSWLLLDELNLARSEILEALNRVLDDNQELFIPELDTMVKPQKGFRIFATQNPNSYSGRSLLSTAFRNRFIVVNFDSHSADDLKEILMAKTLIPKSRADIMLKIMSKLETMRSSEKVFEGKQGLITIRDLLKWGMRRDPQISIKTLAESGYYLLGERIRDANQKKLVKEVITSETKFSLKVDSQLYTTEFSKIISELPDFSSVSAKYNIKFSTQFKRLFCLTHKAFQTKEAVLLIGQTGCGKTTVAQMLAEIYRIPFFSLNCHKHTEASDFLGGWKPRRNREAILEDINSLLREIDSSAEKIKNSASLESVKNILNKYQEYFSEKQIFAKENLLSKLQAEFEWVEGSLVEAVRSGGVYLIDEISLANDSVLERLNSLLEASRQLSFQQSNQEFESLIAHPQFFIIATMNPSGDYGKRELSPALRNRFTEVWVTSILDSDSFSITPVQEIKEFLSSFIETSLEKLITKKSILKKFENLIFDFIYDFYVLINSIFKEAVRPLNMRDLTSLCNIFGKNFDKSGIWALVVSSRVIFEGIIGQIDDFEVAEFLTQKFEILLQKYFSKNESSILATDWLLDITQDNLSFGPIEISRFRKTNAVKDSHENYFFEAPQIKQNLFKLLLGLQSKKPILIEGNPGTGKTSLIEKVAAMLNIEVFRINLSEQTDMIDLLGSHVPDQIHFGFFTWKNGLLLRALKEGAWVIFDELNLANQTILEGLNSILDHRGEVFLPDLGQTVVKAEGFRFFGCQNSMKTARNRKGLPASFLNRFFRIYYQDMTSDTILGITKHIFSAKNKKNAIFENLSQVMNNLAKQAAIGDKFGIRFFLKLILFLSEVIPSNPTVSVNLILKIISQFFLKGQFGHESAPTLEIENQSSINFEIGFSFYYSNGICVYNCQNPQDFLILPCFPYLPYLCSFPIKFASKFIFGIALSVKLGFSSLIECQNSENSDKILKLLHSVAQAEGISVKKLLLYKSADAADLIGNYEQSNWENAYKKLKKEAKRHNVEINYKNQTKEYAEQNLIEMIDSLNSQNILPDLRQKALNLLELIRKDGSLFTWSSSELLKSIIDGKWVIIQGCEIASPAVLEKLNGILEKDEFYLNECFEDENTKKIKKHPNFRLFLIFNKTSKNFQVTKGLKDRCFCLQTDFYFDSKFPTNPHQFNHFIGALNHLKTFGYHPLQEIQSIASEEFANLKNISLLSSHALNLMGNCCLVLNENLPDLEKNLHKLEVSDFVSLLEHKAQKYLLSFFFESNQQETEFSFDYLKKHLTSEQIQQDLVFMLKQAEIRVENLELELPEILAIFLLLKQHMPHIFMKNDRVKKIISTGQFFEVKSLIDSISSQIRALNKSEKYSVCAKLTDSQKLSEIIEIRHIPNKSYNLRLFTTSARDNPLLAILNSESFNVKEKFVQMLNPLPFSSYQQIISHVLTQNDAQISHQLESEIFCTQTAPSSKLIMAQEATQSYISSVENLFEEYFKDFSENCLTIFDETEDSHFSLIAPSEKVSASLLPVLIHNQKLLLTQFDKHHDIFMEFFSNVTDLGIHFQPFIELLNWKEWKSKLQFEKYVSQTIDFQFKKIIKNILASNQGIHKMKFTLAELQLINSFVKYMSNRCAQIQNEIYHPSQTKNRESLAQQLSSKNKDKNLILQSDHLLLSLKWVLHFENQIYLQEEMNSASSFDNHENLIQLDRTKTLCSTFLKDLVTVLEWSFKNQLLIEPSNTNIENEKEFIGEKIYRLCYKRIENISRIPNVQTFKKLLEIIKDTDFSNKKLTSDKINEFLLEIFSSGEFLFNDSISKDVLECLNQILVTLNERKSPFQIIDFYSKYSQDSFSLEERLKICLFERRFFFEAKNAFFNVLNEFSQISFNKIKEIVAGLNESYKKQLKSSGISQAAKIIRLNEQLEKSGKYQYDKRTVMENREERENEFKETFNMVSFEGTKTPEQENVQRLTEKFNRFFIKFWNVTLVALAQKLDIDFRLPTSVSMYLEPIQNHQNFQFSTKSDFSRLSQFLQNLINPSCDIQETLLKNMEIVQENSNLPLINMITSYISSKIKLSNSNNFYTPCSNLSSAQTFSSILDQIVRSAAVFLKDPAFTDLSSLKLLVKSCRSVSELHINSSPANICSAIETIQRNIDEFNASLPENLKLAKERENLRRLLLEMRRKEKHMWKDFVLIKKHEFMNEDFASFLVYLEGFTKGNLNLKLKTMEDAFQTSTLASFVQRMVLFAFSASKIEEFESRRVSFNALQYYASFSGEIQEKIDSHKNEIEEPMKNSMKLMNWHFEDILNIKMNVEKLYRGIHRTVKKQKEILEGEIQSDVIQASRSSLLFNNIGEAHGNLQKAVFPSSIEPIEKVIAKKEKFLSLLTVRPEFNAYFTEKDISFFKLISANKILSLFGAASTKRPLCFKNNLLFKDQLKNFMRNYMARIEDLSSETKQSFAQRALTDFLSDLQIFELKSRFNFQHPIIPQKLFSQLYLCECSKLPLPLQSNLFKKDVNEKTRKINLRLCKIIDCLRFFIQNQNYGSDILPATRERIFSYLFQLYFKLCDHLKQVSKISSISRQISDKINSEEKKNCDFSNQISYLIETNIEIAKTEESISKKEQNILLEVKNIVLQGDFNLAALTLEGQSDFLSKKIIELIKYHVNGQISGNMNSEKINRREMQLLISKISNLKKEFENGKTDNYVNQQLLILKNLAAYLSIVHRQQKTGVDMPHLEFEASVQLLHSIEWIYTFTKFVYFSSIVFSNLVYKGFCMPKDSDDQSEPTEGKVEACIGTGMGEGQGQNNVTGELEYEEQFLGTKDEEKYEDDNSQNPLEENEEEMEMENDFDGTNDRKKKGENEEEQEQEDQAQDEFSDVDDRKSDLQLFEDEKESKQAEENEKLNPEENLQLQAQNLNKENEKVNAAPKDNKEARNLDQEGTKIKEEDSEAPSEMDIESEPEGPEEFKEELPSVQEMESFKEEIPEDFSIDEEHENQNLSEAGEEIDQNKVIEEEEFVEEEAKDGIEEQEEKEEKKDEAETQEKHQIEDSGKLGAQQQISQNAIFGNTDLEENQQEGGGSQSKNQDKQDQMKDFKKQMDSIFRQKVKVKPSSIQKVIENFNFQEPSDSKLPEQIPEQTNDLEMETEEKESGLGIRNRGLDSAQQLDQKAQNQQKESIPSKPKPVEEINSEMPTLEKRELNPTEFMIEEPMKKVKFSEEKAIEAVKEYADTEFEAEKTPQTLQLDNALLVNSEKQKLCEELKAILEQKQVSDLKGDYRTGKRLNMKRVISYIASNYRKDKIWLRRTDPSQQNYRILVGIDDSSSMR